MEESRELGFKEERVDSIDQYLHFRWTRSLRPRWEMPLWLFFACCTGLPRSDLGFWFFAGKLYIREVREILGVIKLEAVICVSELDSVYVDTLVELLDLGVIDVVCVG